MFIISPYHGVGTAGRRDDYYTPHIFTGCLDFEKIKKSWTHPAPTCVCVNKQTHTSTSVEVSQQTSILSFSIVKKLPVSPPPASVFLIRPKIFHNKFQCLLYLHFISSTSSASTSSASTSSCLYDKRAVLFMFMACQSHKDSQSLNSMPLYCTMSK